MASQTSDNQWVRTRAFVAKHLLESHDDPKMEGCMICVAFRWGQDMGQAPRVETKNAWRIAAEMLADAH